MNIDTKKIAKTALTIIAIIIILSVFGFSNFLLKIDKDDDILTYDVFRKIRDRELQSVFKVVRASVPKNLQEKFDFINKDFFKMTNIRFTSLMSKDTSVEFPDSDPFIVPPMTVRRYKYLVNKLKDNLLKLFNKFKEYYQLVPKDFTEGFNFREGFRTIYKFTSPASIPNDFNLDVYIEQIRNDMEVIYKDVNDKIILYNSTVQK